MPKFDMKTRVDDNGIEDLELDEYGEFQFTSTIQESLAQRLSHRLNTWQGDWVYNLSYGTPYEQKLLGRGVSREFANAEIIRVISEEEDITSISGISSSFNTSSRIYDFNVDVYCGDEKLTIPISSPYTKENDYGEPKSFEDFRICTLGEVTTQEINDFYYLINFAMADYNTITNDVGESTWWNVWRSNLP